MGSEERIQSCLEMMGEKGMDMKGMGMMGDGEMKSTEDDHQVHH